MIPESSSSDQKLGLVRQQTDEIRLIMVDNMNKAIVRGEKLDVLNDKAEDLSRHARLFQGESSRLRRMICMKNARKTICLVVVLVIIIGVIVGISYATQK